MPKREAIIEADLTWTGQTFEPNVQVVVGVNGLIEQVGFLDQQPTLRLVGRALLPGLVNAHSIGYQRGLRGYSAEAAESSPGDSLSGAACELVAILTAEAFGNLLRMAFEEMLHHGITTVGEFHVLRHEAGRSDFAFDELALTAARDAGIRIVLLCGYEGGMPAFLKRMDQLRGQVDEFMQRLGIAVSAPPAGGARDLARLAEYAREHKMPLHVSLGAENASAIADLEAGQALGPNVCVVSERPLLEVEARALAAAGAVLCVCPLTAAARGTSLDLAAYRAAGGKVCLGTGCNLRISMAEELRFLEYTTRLAQRTRTKRSEQPALQLWRTATVHGAAALGMPAGKVAPGQFADFFAVDTGGMSLLGATADSLLSAYVFGADRACITNVCVGGVWHNWDR